MNTLWIVVIGVLTIYLAYNLYAKRIDRYVIQADAKRATPARMYMDGVDFMPTSRNVLFGYHFKAIAAAGPIVGPITAANLWRWSPALAWLILGISFIGILAAILSARPDVPFGIVMLALMGLARRPDDVPLEI
ncbi:MAG: carbon starvation CstA family protein [Burkholderiales bacterium]